MLIDFLEESLICLEVSSPSMETQDAHEHILVVGKVCHRLDILDMGVLTKKYALSMYYVCTWYEPVQRSMYQVHTSMYHERTSGA
jgi:hypothetical protein